MQPNRIGRLIAVDFDGTLCDFAYPGIGAIKPGARAALAKFREMGFTIMIYSCRSCAFHEDIFGPYEGLESLKVKDMIKWLDDNQVPYDVVYDGLKGKPMADLYIDDKGMRYQENWPTIQSWVEKNL